MAGRRGAKQGETMAKRRLLALALPILLAAASAGPAAAQNVPQPGMDAPAPLKPGDAFGEPVTLPERTVIYLQGHSKWDGALDTLVEAFKTLNEYMDKHDLKAAGPAMTIYTQTDDSGFSFRAAVPIAEAPKDPPHGDLAIGQAPSGKALKFVHRGSYDAMDETYEAITNYLDDKGMDAKDTFIEEYTGGPLKPGDDNLLVSVFVPVK
jgi:effector-binding domain-containing protein